MLDLADVVRVHPEFSPAEQDRARAAATRDRRLAIALDTSGYGLTQTLAACRSWSPAPRSSGTQPVLGAVFSKVDTPAVFMA